MDVVHQYVHVTVCVGIVMLHPQNWQRTIHVHNDF